MSCSAALKPGRMPLRRFSCAALISSTNFPSRAAIRAASGAMAGKADTEEMENAETSASVLVVFIVKY